MIRNTLEQKRRIPFAFPGSSSAYVLVILFFVCLISYLLVGGLFPRIVKKPIDPQFVQVTDATSSGKTNTLQLVNLQVASARDMCLKTAGIMLLIDESASMGLPTQSPKIETVKIALQKFITELTPTTLVGLSVFSTDATKNDPRELVAFGPYSTNKVALEEQIDTLSAGGETNLKDGVTLVKDRLTTERVENPDSRFFVILVSDGVPVSTEQDPLQVIEEMKAAPLSTSIFSIATTASGDTLMRDIASDPKTTYFLAPSLPDQIASSFQSVSERICL